MSYWEDLVDLLVDDKEPSRVLKIGKNLLDVVREAISDFLGQNLDVFAWTYSDMEGIDPNVISHRLNINPSRKPVRQKRRAMDIEHYQALKEEVDKTPLKWLHKKIFLSFLAGKPSPSQEAQWKVEDLRGLHRFK